MILPGSKLLVPTPQFSPSDTPTCFLLAEYLLEIEKLLTTSILCKQIEAKIKDTNKY